MENITFAPPSNEQQRNLLHETIRSPWKITSVSVLVSLLIVAVVNMFAGYSLDTYGITITVVTSFCISIVMAHLARHHLKLMDNKNQELQRLNEELDSNARTIAQQAQKIAESEACFRSAIDSTAEAFLIVTPLLAENKYPIVELNPYTAIWLRHPREELIGRSLEELVDGTYGLDLLSQCRTAFEQGSNLRTQMACDGHFWDCQFIPLGTNLAIRVADITPLKQAEQNQVALEIERQQTEVLRRFLGDTFHDLMTPITILRNSLYLIGKSPDKSRIERTHKTAQDQLLNLEQMIQDMMTQVKLDSQQDQPVQMESVQWRDFLTKVVASFEPVAESGDKELLFHDPQNPVTLQVNPAQLTTVFSNLINNALKYSPAGCTVSISYQRSDLQVITEVSDNGPGISAEDLPHIFERFYRGAKHRPSDGGSGLGLSICKTIVERHRGSIEAENLPTGGAIFRVKLPVTSVIEV